MSDRFFAFGCSFTRYKWPTWADIMGKEFSFYENWGRSGGGNQFIFNSLIECNQHHQFTPNDTINIMWSGITREDRYITREWKTVGNVYSNPFYDKEFIKKYADDRGYLIRDLATISATIDLLKSWGVKWTMCSLLPLNSYNDNYDVEISTSKNEDVLALYSNVFDVVKPSVYEVIFNCDWSSIPSMMSEDTFTFVKGTAWPTYQEYVEKKFDNYPPHIIDNVMKFQKITADLHPTPSLHLQYLNKVLPTIYLSDETKKWATEYDTTVLYVNPNEPKRL